MTFGSPWLLWGMALGAIPIVVHLLNRRRHRETPWAAMRFLLEATRKNSRRIRLEQLVLLVVRTLILLLLALALARPFVASSGFGTTSSAAVHRVIVLDASYSMAANDGDRSRFDAAVAAAAKVVRGSRPGDALNLVLMRSHGPRLVVGEPSFRHSEVLDELERVRVSHTPGDLVPTLHEVAGLFDRTETPRRKEVVLIGDLQRVDWSPRGEAARGELTAAIAEFDRDVPFTVVDVGDTQPLENVAVAGLELDEGIVAVDLPIPIRVTLEHHGHTARGTHPVELHVDGRLRERKSVALPATGEATVDFTVVFETPGDHVVEVRGPGDVLPLDDTRQLAVRVREELNVLLVDGSPSGRFGESATSFLEVALVPDAGTPSGLLQQRTIGEGELQDVDLARYDCVFVCNVGLVTDREAEVLERYVAGGGGLVLAMGDRVRVENYNRTLFRTEFTFEDVGLVPAEQGRDGVLIDSVEAGSPAQRAGVRDRWRIRSVNGFDVDSAKELQRRIEAGSLVTGLTLVATTPAGERRTIVVRRDTLLPARLREVVRTGPEGDGHAFDAADLSHPIVRAFEGNPEAGLLTTRILHYMAVDETTLGSSRVALPYANGDPAIVTHRLGRGHVVLVTTSLDRDWGGAWPGWPSFPQMMQEIVGFAVSGREAGRSTPVGAPILRTLPKPAIGVNATITRPDGRIDVVPLAASGTILAYDDVDHAGLYVLNVPAPVGLRESFTANLDPAEGDLARVEPKVLDDVLAAVTHRVRREWTAGIATDDASPTGGPVAVWLLTAVACLLLVETVMAWRFAPGFVLLCAVVAMALLARFVSVPIAGGLLGVIAVVAWLVWPRLRAASDR